MRTLFARIFFWFWITGSLTLLASVSVIVFERHEKRPTSPVILWDTSRFFGTAVADVLEESGERAARDYLRELGKNSRMEGYLFDERAVARVGADCKKFQAKATLLSVAGDSEPLAGGEEAVRLESASKRNYIFVSQTAMGSPLSPTYELGRLTLRALVAVVVSGLVCFALARGKGQLLKDILRKRRALASSRENRN